MRGVGVGNNIYLDYASHDVHYGIRRKLGLPGDSGDSTGDPKDGFNFYVVAPQVPWEWEPEFRDEDFRNNLDGRTDWIEGGSPQFAVPGALIFTNRPDEEVVQNRAFARLVGQRLTESISTNTTIEWINDHKASFFTDEQEYIVEFDPFGDDRRIRKISFRKAYLRSTAMTGMNKAGRVLSGVIAAIRMYADRERPDEFLIGAKMNEPSRVKAYQRLVDALAPTFSGYKQAPFDSEGSGVYYWRFVRSSGALSEDYDPTTISILHNPSTEDFMRLAQNATDKGVLRALIDHDGDLYVWDAEKALHGDVDRMHGTTNYISFIIFPKCIDRLGTSKLVLSQAMKANPTLKALQIDRMRFIC